MMDFESLPTSPARSKMEVLYRDLLVECERLQGKNEALAQQIEDIELKLTSVSRLLRDTVSTITAQAGSEATQQLQRAARSLSAVEEALRATCQSWQRVNTNIWFITGIATLSGCVGGLLGVMAALAFSQG